MKLNYYIVGSLPALTWDGDIRGTLQEYLNENGCMLDSFNDGIDNILLYNEIRTLEMILNNNEAEMFDPSIISKERAVAFLEQPMLNRPDEYPDYIEDYFVRYGDTPSRLDNLNELYLDYFTTLCDSDIPFFKFFGKTALIIRTIVSAYRLQSKNISLDEKLVGDEEVVQAIIAHKNSADFGLAQVFPEIGRLQSIMEKDTLEKEKELDLFLLDLLSEYRADDPFGDHVIYLYIYSLFLRDRWVMLDSTTAESMVQEIIQG
ncbi:MAG: DUF2764 family protein [Spirochaetes bacterium]|nr:DUF2764 family protein [Spirochaetota bacterium]MBN2769286.1 DUF2764 family protein [Spirochaetota bacterium]